MRPRRVPSLLLFGLALIVLFGLVGLAVGLVAVTNPSLLAQPNPQRMAYQQLVRQSRTPPSLTTDQGFPRGVLMRVPVSGADGIGRAQDYLTRYADLYLQSDPRLALQVRRTIGDPAEIVIFYQTYDDLPVFLGELSVTLDGGFVTATVGALLPAGLELNTTPSLAAEDAEAFARRDLGFDAAQAPLTAPSTLGVFDPALAGLGERDPRLVWQVTFGGSAGNRAYVDAHDGGLILQFETRTSHTGPFDIDLEDANYTNAYDTLCFSMPDTAEEIGSETGVYPFAQGDINALQAWNRGLQTWLFFHNVFGIHSYDNDGEPMDVYIHSTTPGFASYDPGCDLFQFNDGAEIFDIFVHEFTHAIIATTSNLVYYAQSGALNESFADIMAVRADGNWTIAEDLMGPPVRDLSNPSVDHMNEFATPDDCTQVINGQISNDNYCVHTNSGVQNYVAYLLGVGGTHPDSNVTIKSISVTHTTNLAYLTMNALSSGAIFMDSRVMWVALAQQYIGVQTACQVRNAWYAVGIGYPDIDCNGSDDIPDADGDGIPFGIDNCEGIFNPDQTDVDGDGTGPPCDPDDNSNGILDALEPYLTECPGGFFVLPGFPCDPSDIDDDGVANDDDNCVEDPNPGQEDVDNDGFGDACDPDDDGDGWSTDDDNCPFTYNPDQANADGDFAGDACDPNPDCYDVVAWSSGYQSGEINIPPKPLTNGNCDPNVLLDGSLWQAPALLEGDGPHRVVWEPDDAAVFLPLPVCHDQTGARMKAVIHFVGFDLAAHAWAVDAGGVRRGDLERSGEEGLFDFPTMGGNDYSLVLFRPPSSSEIPPPDDQIAFSLSFDCLPAAPWLGLPPEQELPPVITPTASPATPVPPTKIPPQATVLENARCRFGDSTSFEEADFLEPGEVANVLGRNASSTWIQIVSPEWGMECWVFVDLVELNVPIANLPVLPSPPTPTPSLTPSPTPTETRCPAGIAC